jgi:hypothetical protein
MEMVSNFETTQLRRSCMLDMTPDAALMDFTTYNRIMGSTDEQQELRPGAANWWALETGVEYGGIETHPECAQWATRPLMYMNLQRGETAEGT